VREIVVFGAVGILATLTHYFSAIFAVEAFGWDVMLANVFAYCIAVGVSFFGHSVLTFRATINRDRFVKFVTVSLSALAVSQGLLWLLTSIAIFGHRINMLAVVCVVPVYSYFLNKFWVYR
jgi:putative flippase GtrA